ncbi:protein of unknown function (plasmid) [Vibrio harveyi]|nr:protein of unknown function [Vibrio harveyi]
MQSRNENKPKREGGMKNSVDMQMIMIIIKTSIMKSPDAMIDTTFAHITSSVIIKLIFKGRMPFDFFS